MTSSSVRLIELCLLAAVCLAQAPGTAAAEGTSETRDHSYAYLGNGGNITMSGSTRDITRARSFRQGSVMRALVLHRPYKQRLSQVGRCFLS